MTQDQLAERLFERLDARMDRLFQEVDAARWRQEQEEKHAAWLVWQEQPKAIPDPEKRRQLSLAEKKARLLDHLDLTANALK